MFRYSAAQAAYGPDTFYGMLSEAARRRLDDSSTERYYQAARVMTYEGGQSTHVCVLTRGIAKASFVTSAGQTSVLRVYGAGDVFGSVVILRDRWSYESVTALADCSCRVMPAHRFNDLLATDPGVAYVFSVVMAQRAQAADERAMARLAPPLVRLARVLLDLAERIGAETPDGIGIPVELSQEELASWIDVSRSTIARMFAGLRRRGQIQTSYRHITVADLNWLRSTANSGSYS